MHLTKIKFRQVGEMSVTSTKFRQAVVFLSQNLLVAIFFIYYLFCYLSMISSLRQNNRDCVEIENWVENNSRLVFAAQEELDTQVKQV